MTTAASQTNLVQAHKTTPEGMLFYDSVDAVRKDIHLLGYVSVIERAWKEMGLHGVLFLDTRPVLYLKESSFPLTSNERIYLHNLFWNQGVANILVLIDPTAVYIYSGLIKPEDQKSDNKADESALVEKLGSVDYTLQIQSLYHAIATGQYYRKHEQKFDPYQAVDARLLANLQAFRNALIKGDEGLDINETHAFIGRILFLCYLLDREIFSIGDVEQNSTGTKLLSDKLKNDTDDSGIDFLYELFNELKDRFNGNMFDQDLDSERQHINSSHLNKLILFLGGHEVRSGQQVFWPYNFKMIPVETISAIYEDFLTTEDPEGQKGRGAFYTPRFLAEMVVDIALKNDPEMLNGKFLDPACGSGIFLVILFNRIANQWILCQTKEPNYNDKSKALKNILKSQIRGVDIEETACRIACFSLYLAYLDFFSPPDIQKHIEKTGQPLPKLLDYGNLADMPKTDMPVILKADSLNEETYRGEKFDCVIGNPPWKFRGREQLAQKFMERAPGFLNEYGIGCLLLPTKMLQNQTDSFQEKWLRLVTLESVMQLADYGSFLFSNAKCPAFIARFINSPPKQPEHKIAFSAPKFNRDGLRQGIVIVNPSSRTWIPLADILTATKSKIAPVVWKRHLWGSQRDKKFIDFLQSLPSLNDSIDVLSELKRRRLERTKRWIIGQGLKPWPMLKKTSDRLPKKNIYPLESRFIDARTWSGDLVLMRNDTISLEEHLIKKKYRSDVFYSQPPQELFFQPMVLINQGFTKVAYCDFNVLFQHSLQSIAGSEDDADMLMFLAVYLRSNLARYFLFHTSTNWGTERTKVHLNELLRAPFPLPGNEFISSKAADFLRKIAEKFKKLHHRLGNIYVDLKKENESNSIFSQGRIEFLKKWQTKRKKQVESLQNEIEPLIYDYFGLTEQEIMLIEDTLHIFEPSSKPTTWHSSQTVTLDPIEKTKIEPYAAHGLRTYADTLTNTLNTWAKAEGSQYCVCSEGGSDKQTGLAMVTIKLVGAKAAHKKKLLSKDFAEDMTRLHNLAVKEQGSLHYERNIFLFQDKEIYIIRPNILLNWTRTAALNDAARIYGEISLAQRDL